MSENPDDDRLEELRKQKREQLKQQQQGGGNAGAGAGANPEAQQQAQQQAEDQKKAMLRQYLSDGARRRLNSVKMSKPDLAERVEQQVVALGRSGRLQDQLDEEQMKELLRELKPDSKDFDISRR